GEQLELRGALCDDAARRLVQPVEARIEPRVTAGRVARETEMAVQPSLDAFRLAVQPKEQQLGRRFGEMKEREQEEAHTRVVARVDGGEERWFAQRTLLADRCDDLHRMLEAGWARASKELKPQLGDPSQERQIPARRILARGEEQLVVDAQPVSEFG